MRSALKYFPNNEFAHLKILISFLCVLCASVVNVPAQEYKTIADGVEYAEVTREIGKLPVKMNLLRLDLTKVRLDVHHAMDAAIGTEKTSSIATRHGAFAAINAGFFRLDTSIFAGDAAGVLMMDGELLSESLNDRATLIIGNVATQTNVFFGHYQARVWVEFGEGDWDSFIELSGVNRERKVSEAILYKGLLSQKPNRTQGDLELRLNKCSSLPFSRSSDAKRRCEEVEIVKDGASAKLTNPQFVVSLDPEYVTKNSVSEKIRALERLRKKTVVIRTRINEGNNFFFPSDNVDITNGIPQLIKDGKIDITWEQEKSSKSFVETRHPRTAVAKLIDGKFLMITVDGRSESSGGIGLNDLAVLLLEFGATDAMNLDGGGSTTMFLDGKVVNHPSDKEGERKVSDAILVALRKKSTSK
jgi:hypothetical protein